MADDRIEEQGSTCTALKRRGLIAGAAALVAGIVAKQAALPVGATGATGNTDGGALIIGAPGTVTGNPPNTSGQQTILVATGGGALPSAAGELLWVDASARTVTIAGIRGTGSNALNNHGGIGLLGLGGTPTGANNLDGGPGVLGSGGGALGNGQPGTGVVGRDGMAAFGDILVAAGVRGISVNRRGVVGFTVQDGAGVGVQGIADHLYTNGTAADAVLINAGVSGIGKTTGVQGDVDAASGASGTAGVRGINKATGIDGAGVLGQCDMASSSVGVKGTSTIGTGVVGSTSDPHGTGVIGSSGGGAPGNGNGVYGFVNHAGATQVTAGVFGDSAASYGIIGRTTAVNYSGCTGIADGSNRAAVAGAGFNGAYGAYFVGTTVVAGDFAVVGGQKNAAVKHTDGSYRLLHCVESPEPWFEDFGEAKLVNGKADVKLDADFAAVVDTGAYHVFLTEIGGHSNLAVMAKTGAGFTVGSEKAGVSGSFSWRIVARRKDIKPGRMAKFEVPKIRLPKPEEMPPAARAAEQAVANIAPPLYQDRVGNILARALHGDARQRIGARTTGIHRAGSCRKSGTRASPS